MECLVSDGGGVNVDITLSRKRLFRYKQPWQVIRVEVKVGLGSEVNLLSQSREIKPD